MALKRKIVSEAIQPAIYPVSFDARCVEHVHEFLMGGGSVKTFGLVDCTLDHVQNKTFALLKYVIEFSILNPSHDLAHMVARSFPHKYTHSPPPV
jgi:hypothetical protein